MVELGSDPMHRVQPYPTLEWGIALLSRLSSPWGGEGQLCAIGAINGWHRSDGKKTHEFSAWPLASLIQPEPPSPINGFRQRTGSAQEVII